MAGSCEDWFVVIVDDGAMLVEVRSTASVAEFSNRNQRVVNCWEDVGGLGRRWQVLQCRERENGRGIGRDGGSIRELDYDGGSWRRV